jgi:hypothetical protein
MKLRTENERKAPINTDLAKVAVHCSADTFMVAMEPGRYSNNEAQTLNDKFVLNGADIEIGEKQ